MIQIAWGEEIAEPNFDQPGGHFVRALHEAARRYASFVLCGWRRVAHADGSTRDYLVVDADDGSVPGRNPVGIHRRERLALGYNPESTIPVEVRALRVDFPDVLHLNPVGANEPRSLCMYDDAWESVERSWTPQGHLARILWWLRQTAMGTLHASDQPLESVFYGSPVKLILPRSVLVQNGKKFPAVRIERFSEAGRLPLVTRGFLDDQATSLSRTEAIDFLLVQVAPAESTFMRNFPPSLRALHEDFVAMGSDLIGPLRAEFLHDKYEKGFEQPKRGEHKGTMIAVAIPRLRDGVEETIEVRGFFVGCDAVTLGLKCAALVVGEDGRVYRDVTVIPDAGVARRATALELCAEVAVETVDVQFELNADGARHLSGIEHASSDFRGVLVGVGALGGLLADIWMREGWGEWHCVDDDVLLPHNVVRHVGRNSDLGRAKAHVVRGLAGFAGSDDARGKAFVTAFKSTRSGELAERVNGSALIVDASTTLYVGRDALLDDKLPRMATVFLTPSGHGSALLMDSADRSVRVAHLEPQYYRAILRNDWGQDHLRGGPATAWVGGGCRRLSTSLSNELVHVHGGVLARQVRRSHEQASARLCVWTSEDATGGLRAHEAIVAKSLTRALGDWRVVWDEEIQARMSDLRAQHLPSETGGIVLGYLDQKLCTVFVVDVLAAPPDSDADETGFGRGIEGVEEAIEACKRRTAGVVDYIGEWHSHPTECSEGRSDKDDLLLDYLVDLRSREGLPTLMLIIGEELGISFVRDEEQRK